MIHSSARAGLSAHGLDTVCETCESDIDFPDGYADLGVCRQCGVAFLIDAPASSTAHVS